MKFKLFIICILAMIIILPVSSCSSQKKNNKLNHQTQKKKKKKKKCATCPAFSFIQDKNAVLIPYSRQEEQNINI